MALVVPGGVDRSGRERVIPALLWLIEGLARRHRVTVIALGHDPDAASWPLLGATVLNVPAERRGPHRLARLVARAVLAAASEGRPDVVQSFWANVPGLVATTIGRRYSIPVAVHVAGGELVRLDDIGYGGGLGRGGRLISAAALRGADRITVASEWMADHVRACGYRVDGVIPLGIDRRLFHPGGTAARPDGAPPRLVHVGNLNRVKDQFTLVDALARLRAEVAGVDLAGVELDVVGVDTLGGAVQRHAAERGVADAVRFHGFVPSDRLGGLLRGAQLHLLSSRHDAGPVAVLEAAACGVPTVGTAVGHVADLAALAEPGAVAVPTGDPGALATAARAVLGNPGRRAALASAAQRWAEAHDADYTVGAFEALHRSMVAPAPPGGGRRTGAGRGLKRRRAGSS